MAKRPKGALTITGLLRKRELDRNVVGALTELQRETLAIVVAFGEPYEVRRCNCRSYFTKWLTDGAAYQRFKALEDRGLLDRLSYGWRLNTASYREGKQALERRRGIVIKLNKQRSVSDVAWIAAHPDGFCVRAAAIVVPTVCDVRDLISEYARIRNNHKDW